MLSLLLVAAPPLLASAAATVQVPVDDVGRPDVTEQVAVRWDEWGVPYVRAGSERGAYFGAGYACARLRLFQMCFQRLSVQGRLAEAFGRGRIVDEDGATTDVYLDHDKDLRTFGIADHAAQVVATLRASPDPERREVAALLQAYADGVNAWVADATDLGALFAAYPSDRLDPRATPWSPEDCVGLLLRFSLLRGQGERWREEPELLALLGRLQKQAGGGGQGWSSEEWAAFSRAVVGPTVCDDLAASVQAPLAPGDFVPTWPDRRSFLAVDDDALARMQAYAAGATPTANPYGEPLNPYWDDGAWPPTCATSSPPCSESWAFDGRALEGGGAMVVAEPRLPVLVPCLWVEWYAECPGLKVRGAGLPGTPFLFVGATENAAWGVSSLELDQIDLFRLDVDADGERYRLDDAWLPFDDREERIWIAGEPEPLRMRVLDTVHGPVVDELLADASEGVAYARRAVPLHDVTADGASAFVSLYRAQSFRDVRTALGAWTTPPANLVFAHRAGRVGYQAVGQLPVRKPNQVVRVADCGDDCDVEIGPLAGWVAQDGTRSETLWDATKILPTDLLPHVEPPEGFVFTANNAPAGGWYPIPGRPGLAGHTMRSRRLVERLEALWFEHVALGLPIDPAAVRAPRTDTELATLADLIELARWVVDCNANDPDCPLTIDLLGNQRPALEALEGWLAAGGTLAHAPGRPAHEATLLAYFMPLNFRDTSLVDVFGGGQSGLELYLRDALCRIRSGQPLTDEEADWIRLRFRRAWNILIALTTANEQVDPCRFGPGDRALSVDDRSTWTPYLERHLLERRIPHWVDLETNAHYCQALDRAALTLDSNEPPAELETRLVNTYEHVLWGQPGQLYSQVTRFTEDGPVVTSMLMPEQAEPGHPELDFEDQVGLWEHGLHKDAPMTFDFPGGGEATVLFYGGR